MVEDDAFIAARAEGDEFAPALLGSEKSPQYASFFEELIAAPVETLNYIYAALAVLVLAALSLMVFIEIKRQHPRHIMYAAFLLFCIVSLSYVNQHLLFPDVLVK